MNTHHQEASSSFNNNYLTIEETTIIDCLKKWSGKNSYSILFDSDIDGNGTDNTLPHKILGKNKLYFIHFDENQNVFGGYINSTIDIIQNWIKDPKAFLFSLIRNGKIKNEQYPIQKNSMDRAFSLYNNWYRLYCFGQGTSDILVENVGKVGSWFYSHSYSYNEDINPLVDQPYPAVFNIKRIIVIQMS